MENGNSKVSRGNKEMWVRKYGRLAMTNCCI